MFELVFLFGLLDFTVFFLGLIGYWSFLDFGLVLLGFWIVRVHHSINNTKIPRSSNLFKSSIARFLNYHFYQRTRKNTIRDWVVFLNIPPKRLFFRVLA